MKAILGVSAFYHDSAAALVVDGEIVAAAQEERFTRKKHDASFPKEAVAFCLRQAGITAAELSYVAFYDKPLRKFERMLETYLAFAPRGFRPFLMAMPVWLRDKLHLPRALSEGLGGSYRKRFLFPEHHESHAASAFFPSPFEEAAILTVDGVGEWATLSLGHGRKNRIHLSHELRFPHSLGLLYSAFTYYCGFKVNSGEYKLMGLAPYGEPRYVKDIYSHLLDLKEDGSFRLDLSYFNYCAGLTMTSPRFHALFGGPPRSAESALEQRHMDLAASIQKVTEEIILRLGRQVHTVTGQKRLCLAGGVALNCVANGRLLREGPFEEIWIQPAAGDAGGALGAALFTWHQLLDKERKPVQRDHQRGSLLGPHFDEGTIRTFLDKNGIPYQHFPKEEDLLSQVADKIAGGQVVGWFQSAMEFGPRALGARSILGDPRNPQMQSVMNLKIKFRESFRPFAPSVLEEKVADWFALSQGTQSPYMLLTTPVAHSVRLPLSNEEMAKAGIARLQAKRSTIPAVTHVDYSARVQTVDPERNGRYHRLLLEFERRTGCPVLINTSFNVRGEPIVCTPEDAYRCFMATEIDALVLENYVLSKSEQPQMPSASKAEERAKFLAKFELD